MEELKNRFERLYPGATLFAIHLDGFSHSVFWKDSNGHRHIDGYSAYAPEQYEDDHETYNRRGDACTQSFNKDKTKALFLGYAHYCYQGNAQEFVYEDVARWSKDEETGNGGIIAKPIASKGQARI